MPHIDDGTLHAYLDGALDALAADGALPDGMQAADVIAHLEQCADCRARLELERETRERAGLVLRDAAPQTLNVPPFLATTGASIPPRRPRGRSYLPYAWAASVLLAVGAGWWASQIARDPRVLSRALPSTVPESETAAEPGPIELPVAPQPPTASGQAEHARTREIAPTLPPMRELETATRGEVADQATRAAAAPERAAGQGRNAAGTGAPPAGADRQETASAAVPSAAPAPPPPAPSPLAQSAPAQDPELPVRLDATAVTSFQAHPLDRIRMFVARDSAGRVAWRSATGDEERQIQTGAYALSAAEVIGREVAVEIGATALRVRQRLGTGDPVAVVTWRPEQVELNALTASVATLDSAPGRRVDAREPASRPLGRAMAARIDTTRRQAGQTPAPVAGSAADAARAEKSAAQAAPMATSAAGGALSLVLPPLRVAEGRHAMIFVVRDSDVVVLVEAPIWLPVSDIADGLARLRR